MLTDSVKPTPQKSMSARSGFSASSQHGLTDGEWDSFQTAFTDWYEDSLETMGCYVADVKKILGLPNSHFSQVREFVAPLNETSQRIFIDAQLIACMTVLKASGQYSEWFGMRVEAATEESDRSSGGILDYVFGVTDHNVVTDTSRRIYLEAKRPESISSTLKMEVNRDFLAQGAAGAANLNPNATYCNAFAIYDGQRMLFGYITKASGSVHVCDHVISGEDILRHLLLLIHMGANPGDEVKVETETLEHSAGGSGRRGGGQGGRKHGSGRSARKDSTKKKSGQGRTDGS